MSPPSDDLLDRIRRLLADGCLWERPSPAVLTAIVDRIREVCSGSGSSAGSSSSSGDGETAG